MDPTSHVVPLLLYSFAHTTKKPPLCREQKLWINAIVRMQHEIGVSVTYTHAIQWRNPIRLPPLTRETRPPRQALVEGQLKESKRKIKKNQNSEPKKEMQSYVKLNTKGKENGQNQGPYYLRTSFKEGKKNKNPRKEAPSRPHNLQIMKLL